MKLKLSRKGFVYIISIFFILTSLSHILDGFNIPQKNYYKAEYSKIEDIHPFYIEDKFFKNKEHFNGYILFSPEFSTKTYLINNEGRIVHKWKSNHLQGLAVYLLENGNLLRSDSPGFNKNFLSAGYSGRVEMFDWNGTLIWEFEYLNKTVCLHNDIEPLPNGNILMIVWEIKDYNEAINAGCNPELLDTDTLRTDYIIEVEPTGETGGNIVWEWHIWDHLIQDYDPTKDNYGVVKDHPELIDINFRGIRKSLIFPFLNHDLTHINSIDYNEKLDQILLSSRNLNEILIIDHNTTTEEAASHTGGRRGRGGDILYRWGNPQVYRAGNTSNQKLFGPHDARWIELKCPGEGHISIFNNGFGRPGEFYSSIDEIILPLDGNGSYYLGTGSYYGPEEPIWRYISEHPLFSYSGYISGAQRISNGNTIVCIGTRGIFFEVTYDKRVIWNYINLFPIPILGLNQVFKIQYYPFDYPGLITLYNDFN